MRNILGLGLNSFRESNNNIQGEPFEDLYCCYSVTCASPDYLERGNKVLLPPSALNTLARMNVNWPMLFKISHMEIDLHTHCGVLEFTADEGICYLPYWLMENFALCQGDFIKVTNVALPKGTYVKLRPTTPDFLEISDHRAVLEYSLRFFAALTVGDRIDILHNEKSYQIDILDLRPQNAVSIIETDIEVDFALPEDSLENIQSAYPENSHIQNTNLIPTTESTQPTSFDNNAESTLFQGQGYRMDGKNIPLLIGESQQSKPNQNKSTGEQRVGHDHHGVEYRRIFRGVRTHCAEYQELLESGKIHAFTPVFKLRKPDTFSIFQGKRRYLS